MGSVHGIPQANCPSSVCGPLACDLSYKNIERVFEAESSEVCMIMVVGARGLPYVERSKGVDRFLYCTVKASSWSKGIVYSTTWVKNVLDPIWKEECVFNKLLKDDSIEFCIYDAEEHESQLLGTAVLDCFEFKPNGFNGALVVREGFCRLAALDVKVKIGAGTYPDECSLEFPVSIENPKKKRLGLNCDTRDGNTLYILGVKSGVIHSFNQTVRRAARLLPGQFIMNVNKVGGNSQELLKTMKSAPRLELVVSPPMEIRALINANSADSLGFEFTKRLFGKDILVTKVIEGPETHASPVQVWNEANPGQQIREGDRIIAVNGLRGSAADLIKRIRASVKSSAVYQITVVRPACYEERHTGSNKAKYARKVVA